MRRVGATLHRSARASSPSRPLLLRSTGSRRADSVIVAHGPSCSAACGILPDQGSNPCPLHWQADSQPLRHQGSPHFFSVVRMFKVYSLSSFYIHNTVLLAIIAMMHIRSPELIDFFTGIVPFDPPPQPLVTTTLLSVSLSSAFLTSIYK